jgi:hypothetical protein
MTTFEGIEEHESQDDNVCNCICYLNGHDHGIAEGRAPLGEEERKQLIEKLCAAVAGWLQEEANTMSMSGDRYDALALRYAAEKAEEPTGRGEHLVDLLDAALGEVE